MSTPTLPGLAVFPEQSFGLVQPRGRMTGDTIVEYGLAIVSLPEWQSGYTEVWDLTFTSTVDVLPPDIGKLFALEKQVADRLRDSTTLVITPRSAVLYTTSFYARMMRPLGRRIEAVRSQSEAAEFLGIDEIPTLPA